MSISPGIETNLKGSEVGVVNANSAGAEYLCAGDIAGMNLDPNQFYVTGQVGIPTNALLSTFTPFQRPQGQVRVHF